MLYLKKGLESHQLCVYIAPTFSFIEEALTAAGVDVPGYRSSGQLLFFTSQETYYQAGYFDPDRMIAWLETSVAVALKRGYQGLRGSVEVGWAREKLPGAERLLEYEAKLNLFLPGKKATTLCQYDKRLPPEVLLEVLRIHPLIIWRDMLCSNPYYVPPREYLQKQRLPEKELERYLNRLQEREELLLELGRQVSHLEAEIARRTKELERTNQKLSLLGTVASLANRSSTVEEVLGVALDKLLDITGMEGDWVQLLDQEKGELVLSAYRGLSPEAVAETRVMKIGQSITGWVAQLGQAAVIEDARRDPRVTSEAARREGWRGMVVLPLTARGGVVGVMGLTTRQPKMPLPTDVALLESLGAEIGIAIDRGRLHQQVQELSATDAMTGLRNMRYLRSEAEREIARARREHTPLSLILIDVDDLKVVNDRFGHETGDQLLIALGEVLKGSVRSSDLVGRYGGDEFLVLLLNTDSLGAYQSALRIKESIGSINLKSGESTLTPSVSQGIASYPAHASDFPGLLRKADAAMYEGKKKGMNHISIFSETLSILP